MNKLILPSKKQINDVVIFTHQNQYSNGATLKGRILRVSFIEESIIYDIYELGMGEIHIVPEQQLVLETSVPILTKDKKPLNG